MIALDASRWNELTHAYGNAADIPDLLRKLALSPQPSNDPEGAPWFELWSSLCHQDDVYTASYAAVPHIVDIATRASGPVDFGFFLLPAAIEVARVDERGPPVPADLAASYREAVSGLIDCVAAHRHESWDQAMLLSAAGALAVAKGHHDVAKALINLDNDMIASINAQVV